MSTKFKYLTGFTSEQAAKDYSEALYNLEQHPTSSSTKYLFGWEKHPTLNDWILIIPEGMEDKVPSADLPKLIDSLSSDWFPEDPDLVDYDAAKFQKIWAPISDHPTDPTIRREAELIRFNEIDFLNERLSLVARVKHFKKSDDSPLSELNFNKTLKVNQDEQVPDGQGGTIGQFSYYWAAYDSGVPFLDLVPAGMQVSDSLGRFNENY